MSFEIPGVLWRRDPQADEVPLVFNSPHSGSLYPEDFRFCCPLEVLRRAEDAYVDELYTAAPEHRRDLIGAVFPRSYLDLNRAADDLDPALLDGVWPSLSAPSHKTRAGLAWCAGLPGRGSRSTTASCTVDEVLARVERYHTPYHRVLDEACDRLHAQIRRGLACQLSFDAVAAAARKKGGHCADFVLGDRDGTTCDARIHRLRRRRVCAARGYDVRVNEVYKGVEIVQRQGRPAEHRHSLQIEVDRALYMDQKTLGEDCRL